MGKPIFATVFLAVVDTIMRQAKAIGISAGVVIAIFAVISLFMGNPLATFLRLLSFTGLAMMLLSVGLMLLTFRSAKEVIPAAYVAALVFAVAGTLLIFWSNYGRPTGAVTFISLIAGGGLGYAWSRTTVFFVVNGRLKTRGTAWYLAIWALTLIVNQVAVLLAGHSPQAVQCLALAGAGLAVGNTAGLLWAAHRAASVLHLAGGSRHV